MIEDIKSFFWFLFRGPKYYSTLFVQIFTKFRKNQDSDLHLEIATNWCKERVVSTEECLKSIGIPSDQLNIEHAFDKSYSSKINEVISSSQSNFGGPGHIDLIYTICERLGIKNAINLLIKFNILKNLKEMGL